MRTFVFIFCYFFLQFFPMGAKTFEDSAHTKLKDFFREPGATYIIKNHHKTKETIQLPPDITILFEGGSISCDLVLNGTLLKGNVKLQGTTISGTIRNSVFNAQWLCYADGKRDDAENINSILKICKEVKFTKGIYLLESMHHPIYKINKPYHIGINRTGIKLTGEKGAILTSKTMAGMLCIYSKPYDIKNSIHDIKIEGLTFTVQNESTNWDSYQEHCHTVSLMGVNGLIIEKCEFQNFWGDAICLNHYGDNVQTGERARNINIIIRNNRIDGYKFCNRNGISVINGQSVIIENNRICNTSYHTMPGAIDIEANDTAYTVDNIKIRENKIDNCQGKNGAISVISNKEGAPAHNIEITNNRITNSRRAFRFYVWKDYTASNIIVKNNYIDKNTDPWKWDGTGRTRNWEFIGNTFRRPTSVKFGQDIKIEGLTYKNNRVTITKP